MTLEPPLLLQPICHAVGNAYLSAGAVWRGEKSVQGVETVDGVSSVVFKFDVRGIPSTMMKVDPILPNQSRESLSPPYLYAAFRKKYKYTATFFPFHVRTLGLYLPWPALLCYATSQIDDISLFRAAITEARADGIPFTPANYAWFLARVCCYTVLGHLYYLDRFVTRSKALTCDTLDISREIEGGDCEDMEAEIITVFNGLCATVFEAGDGDLKALQLYARQFHACVLFVKLKGSNANHAMGAFWPRDTNQHDPIVVDGTTWVHPCLLWPENKVPEALRFTQAGVPDQPFWNTATLRTMWVSTAWNPYDSFLFCHALEDRDITYSVFLQDGKLGANVEQIRHNLDKRVRNDSRSPREAFLRGFVDDWRALVKCFVLPLKRLSRKERPVESSPVKGKLLYMCANQEFEDAANQRRFSQLATPGMVSEKRDGELVQFDVLEAKQVQLYDGAEPVWRVILKD